MKNDENFKKNEMSKSEINAERILKRIHVHDFDSSGVFSFITGAQGFGKTSVMLSFMDYTIKNYPDEKIFFNNCYNAPLQFVKIGKDKFHIMVKKDSGVTFHDRSARSKKIYPDVTFFKDFDDLFDKARPGFCNAVLFVNRGLWMDFLHHLRSIGEWVHVYIDELNEICPAFTSGKLFKKIGMFSVDLKEVRKCMMNVHCKRQALPEIDHRVRTKLMIRIFLPGARAGKDSRIVQTAIDNLAEIQYMGTRHIYNLAVSSAQVFSGIFTNLYRV